MFKELNGTKKLSIYLSSIELGKCNKIYDYHSDLMLKLLLQLH